MRAVVQRVRRARVETGGRTIGEIERGLMVLLGVAREDSESDAQALCERIIAIRLFADAEGKMNLDLAAVGGALLVVSQFTLMADTRSGRRPSFVKAAPAAQARSLYERFLSLARGAGVRVESGEFGAAMEVHLVNDGPVTVVLDSRER